ncbi:phosphoglycerate mutase family protein [Litoribaculum gwangyangense]|uniref:Phosphoglycerate mutase n=1 Tax=Litoribaculum gwangyangense TaxID=1130722 RepID=A0ABP9CHZ2_9FLAO
MKFLKTLAVISIFFSLSCKKEQKTIQPSNESTSIFYFIRHAEKDRSDSTNQNPHLNKQGSLRAEKWNDVFKNISFDAIYSTDYNRTRETAAPTASKNNLELIIYNPKTIDISKFLSDNEGKHVLVVGHSNTTPDFVNKILGSETYEDIDDSNNKNLYIVTKTGNTISSNLLFIE